MKRPALATGPALEAGVLLFAAGVILSFAWLHADNNDASLYTLIGQRLAADRTPFRLWWAPQPLGGHPEPFFEHPPLFFWIEAIALTISPGFNPGLIGAVCGLITVASAFATGRALLGERAAFFGCIVLITTESFSRFQPLARLDPPLTAAFTASVALLVTSRGRWTRAIAGGLIAGLGALVKGPPALGAPVIAAALLAACGDRQTLSSTRCWIAAVAATLIIPLAFLACDRFLLDGKWWNGYVIGQVYASALGDRRQHLGAWPLFRTFLGRFWPGLPFAVIALFRRRPVRWALLAWGAVFYLAFAGRRYWFYLMPAYPAMALLAGAGIEDLLGAARAAKMITSAWRVSAVSGALLLVALPLKLFRGMERPCPFGELPARARTLATGGAVAILPTGYGERVIFSDHCGCDAVTAGSFDEAAAHDGASVVLATRGERPLAGWHEAGTHGTWVLFAKDRAH